MKTKLFQLGRRAIAPYGSATGSAS